MRSMLPKKKTTAPKYNPAHDQAHRFRSGNPAVRRHRTGSNSEDGDHHQHRQHRAARLPAAEVHSRTGITVQYVAVGTGAALKIGEQGDADVVLVHDRESEEKFVAAGFGVKRRDVMYNDFVIVGAPADPAQIRGMKDAAEALKRIRAAGSAFVSRGDRSGTHLRELQLWRAAGVEPRWE